MKRLYYYEDGHIYELENDDGTRLTLPSVTEIAAAVTGKDFAGVPKKVLKEAEARGKAIHKDVEDHVFMTTEGQWIKTQLPEICYQERREFGAIKEFMFAGTLDVLSDDAILDIKTQYEKDILYWTIQLNLYRQFFKEVKTLAVLWTPKSESYERVPIRVLSDDRMHEIVEAYQTGKILPADWLDEKQDAPTYELSIYSMTPGQLATNARAILATVKAQLANYSPDNYSPENIGDAKKDKAELNNAAKKLSDRRLELERQWMQPFNEFKEIIAETVNEIKSVSGKIDTIVKEVEQREKDEKKALIEKAYQETGYTLVGLNQLWEATWLNKTVKVADIKKELAAKIEKINADLAVLERIGEPQAQEVYLETLNIQAALAEADRLKANRERLAAMKAQEAKRPEPEPESMPEQKAPEPVYGMNDDDEILERTFMVRCSRALIRELGDFMNQRGIHFEKI